jgi:hypothetical protein
MVSTMFAVRRRFGFFHFQRNENTEVTTTKNTGM